MPSSPSSHRSHLLKPQPLAIQNGNLFEDKAFSLVAQMVKNLPAMQETWVQSLGLEDPLEKEMATHSSILG